MNKIEELKAEVQRLGAEEAERNKAKYQYLVGKCMRRYYRCYEKITQVGNVNTCSGRDLIAFTCITVILDDNSDGYALNVGVKIPAWNYAFIDKIEKCLISTDDFNNAFNACIELMKKKNAEI